MSILLEIFILLIFRLLYHLLIKLELYFLQFIQKQATIQQILFEYYFSFYII